MNRWFFPCVVVCSLLAATCHADEQPTLIPQPDMGSVVDEQTCCRPEPLPPSVSELAAAQIAAQSQTGTLMFSRGDCLAVRIYTRSGYTHVATIVMEGDSAMVYDSMNGPGVRKLPLAEYLATQAPDEVHLFHPSRPFTADEATEFQEALDAQLGRPYSVKHHLTGHRNVGLHCSEYLTDALAAIDWLKVNNPVLVSPATLHKGITSNNIYTTGSELEIERIAQLLVRSPTWYGRAWQSTKTCSANSCRQLSRWVLCR